MGPLDRTRVSLFTASNVLETVRPGDSPDRELTRPRLKPESTEGMTLQQQNG